MLGGTGNTLLGFWNQVISPSIYLRRIRRQSLDKQLNVLKVEREMQLKTLDFLPHFETSKLCYSERMDDLQVLHKIIPLIVDDA